MEKARSCGKHPWKGSHRARTVLSRAFQGWNSKELPGVPKAPGSVSLALNLGLGLEPFPQGGGSTLALVVPGGLLRRDSLALPW